MTQASSTFPAVAVVILNWNGQHWLERFLNGVLATPYPNLQVVVGDNASTDNSIAYLKANFPQITIIQNDTNYGFAEGYNKVLKHIKADYYVLLNSDVEVKGDWISPVIREMDANPAIAAAQPLFILQTNPEFLEYSGAAGGFMDKYGYMFCQGRIFHHLEKEEGQFPQSKEIFWACGACLFIKSKAFWEMEGFDADFFAHQEEVDLCWRLKNAGYQVWYSANSKVWHVGGGMLPPSNPFKTFLNFRNSLFLLYKNLPQQHFHYRLFLRLVLDGIAGIKFLTEGKWKETLAIIKAHRAFFKAIPQLKVKRNNSIKKVAPEQMAGFYNRSIIVDFYFKKKNTFSQLNPKQFYKP